MVDLTADEIDDLYRAADAFALLTRDDASEFEGFGLVFIEAASHGLPVVAGRSGGSVDAVCDQVNGFVVESVVEAADALRRLGTSETLRTQMSAASREFARRFSIEAATNAVLDVQRSSLLSAVRRRQ